MTSGLIIYTDGGARGNPGPAGIGVAIADAGGKILGTHSESIGEKTNNEAEYYAVLTGLKKAKKMLGKSAGKNIIELRLDSELVARQLKGEYKVKDKKLAPLFIDAWNSRQDFAGVVITEIPREKNKTADKLANLAMDQKAEAKLF